MWNVSLWLFAEWKRRCSRYLYRYFISNYNTYLRQLFIRFFMLYKTEIRNFHMMFRTFLVWSSILLTIYWSRESITKWLTKIIWYFFSLLKTTFNGHKRLSLVLVSTWSGLGCLDAFTLSQRSLAEEAGGEIQFPISLAGSPPRDGERGGTKKK